MATITAKAPKNNLIYGFAPYQAKPDEAYMNAAQVHHFKNILNAWKQELMEEVDRTVHHMQDESSSLPLRSKPLIVAITATAKNVVLISAFVV